MPLLADLGLRSIQSSLNITNIVQGLSSKGLVIFEASPSRAELLAIAQSLGSIYTHRDSDENGVTVLKDNGSASPESAGFTARHLFPHTDASGDLDAPDFVVFHCEQQAVDGGESLFVDGKQLYFDISTRYPALLTALRSPRAAVFWSASSYVTAPIISHVQNRVSFRFRLDDLVFFSRDVSYMLTLLKDLIDKHTQSLRLLDGQGFILNNGWWLHGRTEFKGQRSAARILIQTARTSGLQGSHGVLLRGFAL